jgi:hypothetical protein
LMLIKSCRFFATGEFCSFFVHSLTYPSSVNGFYFFAEICETAKLPWTVA